MASEKSAPTLFARGERGSGTVNTLPFSPRTRYDVRPADAVTPKRTRRPLGRVGPDAHPRRARHARLSRDDAHGRGRHDPRRVARLRRRGGRRRGELDRGRGLSLRPRAAPRHRPSGRGRARRRSPRRRRARARPRHRARALRVDPPGGGPRLDLRRSALAPRRGARARPARSSVAPRGLVEPPPCARFHRRAAEPPGPGRHARGDGDPAHGQRGQRVLQRGAHPRPLRLPRPRHRGERVGHAHRADLHRRAHPRVELLARTRPARDRATHPLAHDA